MGGRRQRRSFLTGPAPSPETQCFVPQHPSCPREVSEAMKAPLVDVLKPRNCRWGLEECTWLPSWSLVFNNKKQNPNKKNTTPNPSKLLFVLQYWHFKTCGSWVFFNCSVGDKKNDQVLFSAQLSHPGKRCSVAFTKP